MGLEDKLKSTVDGLKEKAEGAVGDAAETLKEKAEEKVKEVTSSVEGTVGSTVDNLKDSVDKLT
ncbi:MAG: hypothetical protein AAFP20_05700 [Cyanobacteria bacterium J06614_10]